MQRITLNKRGNIYWYHFRISGERYRGSTGTSNYDEAQKVAREAWEREDSGNEIRSADEIFSEYHAKLDKTRASAQTAYPISSQLGLRFYHID